MDNKIRIEEGDNPMKISLTNEESRTFFDIVNSEVRCLVNEYDPDTARCPGKKRMQGLPLASSIEDKWKDTQPQIGDTGFINLDTIVACDIDLTDKECSYAKKLLEKAAVDIQKELAGYEKPYTGMLLEMADMADTAKEIAAKL